MSEELDKLARKYPEAVSAFEKRGITLEKLDAQGAAARRELGYTGQAYEESSIASLFESELPDLFKNSKEVCKLMDMGFKFLEILNIVSEQRRVSGTGKYVLSEKGINGILIAMNKGLLISDIVEVGKSPDKLLTLTKDPNLQSEDTPLRAKKELTELFERPDIRARSTLEGAYLGGAAGGAISKMEGNELPKELGPEVAAILDRRKEGVNLALTCKTAAEEGNKQKSIAEKILQRKIDENNERKF